MSTLSRVTTTAPRLTAWPGVTGTLATRPEICGPMRATWLGTKSTEPATVRLERRGTRCHFPVASLAPASARGDRLTSTPGSFFSLAGSVSAGCLHALIVEPLKSAKAANAVKARIARKFARLVLTTDRSVPDLGVRSEPFWLRSYGGGKPKSSFPDGASLASRFRARRALLGQPDRQLEAGRQCASGRSGRSFSGKSRADSDRERGPCAGGRQPAAD